MALIVSAKLTRMLLNGIVDFPVPQNRLNWINFYIEILFQKVHAGFWKNV